MRTAERQLATFNIRHMAPLDDATKARKRAVDRKSRDRLVPISAILTPERIARRHELHGGPNLVDRQVRRNPDV
jgi:hypothetical protein